MSQAWWREIRAPRSIGSTAIPRRCTVVEGNPQLGPIVIAPEGSPEVGLALLAFLQSEAIALYGSNGLLRLEAVVPHDPEESCATVCYLLTERDVAAPHALGNPIYAYLSRDLDRHAPGAVRKEPTRT